MDKDRKYPFLQSEAVHADKKYGKYNSYFKRAHQSLNHHYSVFPIEVAHGLKSL